MTQEEKELLLRDLSARLTYGVICRTQKEYTSDSDFVDKEPIKGILIGICYDVEKVTLKHIPLTVRHNYDFSVEEIRPYLRPMSSMTEEENNERKQLGILCAINSDHERIFDGFGNEGVDTQLKAIDWLNKKMFAYRTIDGKDMFELGLACQAPEGMYNIKEK